MCTSCTVLLLLNQMHLLIHKCHLPVSLLSFSHHLSACDYLLTLPLLPVSALLLRVRLLFHLFVLSRPISFWFVGDLVPLHFF
jgi:hypothetical protein